MSRLQRYPRLLNRWTPLALLPLVWGWSAAPTIAVAQEARRLEIVALQLGFDGVYKLGCWTPVEVTLRGGDDDVTGVVQIVTPDPEGVPTSVLSPPDRPVGVFAGQETTARLFVRPGQDGGAFQVRFLDEGQRELAKQTFYPAPDPGGEYVPFGRPATNRLIVTFALPRGVGALIRDDGEQQDEALATRATNLPDAAQWPTEWYGYEGVDLVVLGGAEAELYRPLSANPQRIEALLRWVELGGRLVIFCGANAPELIGPDGPLAPLVPGVYDSMTTLRQSQPIEAFAVVNESIPGSENFRLQTPRIVDVEGRILAFSGSDPTDLPLVIRARLGLGEVTFAGFDPDSPPLADWDGRSNLLKQILQWPSAARRDDAYSAPDDLIDRLRRELDGSFQGVTVAPFGLVAALVIFYILLIGPGDYFFVKNVLKRMELTWITFPLLVIVTSAAAYWGAHWMKGDQLRVNQVEIVDVDLSTGRARGAMWTHFFSPRVERYNLTLAPQFGGQPISEPSKPNNEPGHPNDSPGRSAPGASLLVGWLGATGYGLDGMQNRGGGQLTLFDRGYAFNPSLSAIIGLPVQEWSTRTLVGRWTAELSEPITAELRGLDDDLLAGHLTNRTGLSLEGCLLLHGNWAYALPNLADGAVATIDESLQPRTVKTALIAGDVGASAGSSPTETASRLNLYEADVPQLVKTMMFYDALGAEAYAQGPDRYQPFVDMSRLLKGSQAILLARAATPGSNWTDGEKPLASDQDRRWTYYRFVIPLKEE